MIKQDIQFINLEKLLWFKIMIFNILTVLIDLGTIQEVYCFYLEIIALPLYFLQYEYRKLVAFGTLLNVWNIIE